MIRPATIGDAEAVAELYLAARKQHLPFAPLAHSDNEVRDWIKRVLIPGRDVLVVEEDGEIRAFMALAVRESVGWIDQLYCHPNMTRRGYGAALIAHATKVLPSPIQLYTFQENCGARRFYEREGFLPLQFSDGQLNEERCPDVLYEWRRPTANSGAC